MYNAISQALGGSDNGSPNGTAVVWKGMEKITGKAAAAGLGQTVSASILFK